jgi:hypothetical protein
LFGFGEAMAMPAVLSMVGTCSSSTSDDYSSFVMHLCEFSLSIPLDFATEVPFF